jgi:hypothetical protein
LFIMRHRPGLLVVVARRLHQWQHTPVNIHYQLFNLSGRSGPGSQPDRVVDTSGTVAYALGGLLEFGYLLAVASLSAIGGAAVRPRRGIAVFTR